MITTHDTRAVIGLRAPDSRPRMPGPIRGTSVHYNGSAMRLLGQPHSSCRSAWRGIQNYHMNTNGWVDVAYSMGACHHGILLAGRGAGVRTAANGTNRGNNEWYAIMGLLGEGEEPPMAMKRAIVDGARMLGAPRLNAHSDHKTTACPGNPFRTWVHNGAPLGAVTEEDDVFVVRYDEGPDDARVRRAQVILKVAGEKAGMGNLLPRYGADGHYGSETADAVNAFARRAGLPEDGTTGMDILILDYCRMELEAARNKE